MGKNPVPHKQLTKVCGKRIANYYQQPPGILTAIRTGIQRLEQRRRFLPRSRLEEKVNLTPVIYRDTEWSIGTPNIGRTEAIPDIGGRVYFIIPHRWNFLYSLFPSRFSKIVILFKRNTSEVFSLWYPKWEIALNRWENRDVLRLFKR